MPPKMRVSFLTPTNTYMSKIEKEKTRKKQNHTFLLHCAFADMLFPVFIPVASSISKKKK